MQRFVGNVRKAIEKYNMIDENDIIAVGLSGGKDSLSLLFALKQLQAYFPKHFNLIAICIDLGMPNSDYSKLKQFCKELGIPFYLEKSDIYSIVFEIRKEKNPCSLCSKLRRGMLCSKAKELGANKLALGHHADDLVETLFLSMFYEGRLSTFSAKSYLSKTEITVIRPLLLSREKEISKISKQFPVFHNACPANKNTKREYVKKLLKSIETDVPIATDRIFDAITSPERYNLFDKKDEQ